MAYLNNDQRLKKAHKDVRQLGNIASTILIVELTEMINARIQSVKDAPTQPCANPLVSNKAVIELLETFINPLHA
tara:strand:+ start:1509 stop:1733 length:225 start_codon:yes stop_codon:yes gene_type:complete